MICQNTTTLFNKLEAEVIEMRYIDSTDEGDTLMMETAFICLCKQARKHLQGENSCHHEKVKVRD